jgi:hypothetical protein
VSHRGRARRRAAARQSKARARGGSVARYIGARTPKSPGRARLGVRRRRRRLGPDGLRAGWRRATTAGGPGRRVGANGLERAESAGLLGCGLRT